MCLLVSYKKKIWKKYFFASLKSMKKSDSELDPDPDTLVKGTDPQYWSRRFSLEKLAMLANGTVWIFLTHFFTCRWE